MTFLKLLPTPLFSSNLIDEDGATIFTKRFDVKDENKRQIVSTSAEKTTIGSKKLEILGNI